MSKVRKEHGASFQLATHLCVAIVIVASISADIYTATLLLRTHNPLWLLFAFSAVMFALGALVWVKGLL